LTREERIFLKNSLQNENIVYMWEDKGASFTKMTTEQYLLLGEKELETDNFIKIQNDPSAKMKAENDKLVNKMLAGDEISGNVANFLLNGDQKLSNFYHVIKTHKIPPTNEDPGELPVRGIISARLSPLEKIGRTS
jgi:hypothetical protein